MSLVETFQKNVGKVAGFGLPAKDANSHVDYAATEGVFKTQDQNTGKLSWGTDQFQFLFYEGGAITQISPNGLPVLSGPFSGCFMVVYKRGGTLYVGHIGTKETNANADVKDAWAAFETSTNGTTNVVVRAFNPDRSVAKVPLIKEPPPLVETPKQAEKRRQQLLKEQDEAKKVLELRQDSDSPADLPRLYALVTGDVANPKAYAIHMIAQKADVTRRRILKVQKIAGTTDKPLFRVAS